ncbi:MAG: winged helix-turn-helix domain-containing protein [Woeseiaceae bacterium]|nr:winged helix-turn-helix domain-containing protein [Woeseiaceae bacterium]
MSADQNTAFEFRGFRLEPGRRRLLRPDGDPATLRTKEFDTLRFLVERAGEPVGKDALLAAVWPGVVVEENNLNQAISKLRQALGDDRHDPDFIATLPGRGYQFVASVRRLPADSVDPADTTGQTGDASRFGALAAALVAVALVAGFIAWNVQPVEPQAPFNLEGARLVTSSSSSYSMPTLSPDGTLMAFVSDRSGVDQIWVQGLPDGTPLQITHGDDAATAPNWSPIDDSILFQRARSIWVTNALGSEPPRPIVHGGSWPRFTPDGRSFTFTRGITDIHIGHLDRDEVKGIESLPETPGFAPAMAAMNAAGDIAFVLADEGPSGNLWVHEAATGEPRQLTQSESDFAGVWAEAPVWTPDGQSIIYVASHEQPGNTHLWQTNVRTREMSQLSTGVGGYGQPAISRDGSRLLYSYSRPLWRLLLTDPATGATDVLHESRTNIVLPAISRDGETIVFFFDNVYTQSVAGGEPRQLTFGKPGEATLPVWSRSDDVIYYYRNRNLHRLDPETNTDELVVENFHWSSQHWLAVHGDKIAYRQRTPVESARSVILDVASGEEIVLNEPLLPTDWSRDGKTLLGTRLGDIALMTCVAPEFTCEPLLNAGKTIRGSMPRWSGDESRVFFRREQLEPGYADIFAVPVQGGEREQLAEIGPYEFDNVFFAVTNDDRIVWNQYDPRGRSELWMTDDPADSD